MHVEMNAIAHASAVPASGPQLDNRRIAAALIDLAIVVGGAFVIGLAAGLSGELTPFGHRLLARVYYADTDFSGVVYVAGPMQ